MFIPGGGRAGPQGAPGIRVAADSGKGGIGQGGGQGNTTHLLNPGHGGTPPGLMVALAASTSAIVAATGGSPAFAAAYDAAVLADTPRGYWKLDEPSGNFADSSGNGLTMTASGSLTYSQSGPFTGAGAVLFAAGATGTRSQVSALADNITMEAWVYPTSRATYHSILSNENGGLNGYDYVLDVNGRVNVVVQGTGVEGPTGTAIPNNAWTYLCIRRSANFWTSYIAGALDGTMGNLPPGPPSGGQTQIGTSTWVGRLSRVAFYESVLTPARMLAHYHAAGF